MGGQDGYSRDMLDYSSESNSLMAGLKYKKAEKLELGLDLSWMKAEAGLAPFDLSADDYVATHPPMSYDFSTSHTYSDLDSSRVDADLWAKFWFRSNLWMRLRYQGAGQRNRGAYYEGKESVHGFFSVSVASFQRVPHQLKPTTEPSPALGWHLPTEGSRPRGDRLGESLSGSCWGWGRGAVGSVASWLASRRQPGAPPSG